MKTVNSNSYLMTPKDNYLILYQWGKIRSKWLYYIDTGIGQTLGETEIDGEWESNDDNVLCVSKSNDIICYSNEPPSIYYLEFNANLPQKLNKRELINGNKKYEGKIRIKKQYEFIIVKDDHHVEIYKEDDLKRNGLNNPYFEAETKDDKWIRIENGYLFRDESEFLVYKLNQFDKPWITINKDVRSYSISPNKKYLIIGTWWAELIVFKLNDLNVTQFAYLKLNEEIEQIVSSDQYIYIRSGGLLTFKIKD